VYHLTFHVALQNLNGKIKELRDIIVIKFYFLISEITVRLHNVKIAMQYGIYCVTP